MGDRFVITHRAVSRIVKPDSLNGWIRKNVGTTPMALPHGGAVAAGRPPQPAPNESRDLRVKLLRDATQIRIGGRRIDPTTTGQLRPDGRVPRERESSWRHHLIQLAAPPARAWIAELRKIGLDVVERVASCGVFVVGSPEALERARRLGFVDWAIPFQPAFRVSPQLGAIREGPIRYVSVAIYPPEEIAAVRTAIAGMNGQLAPARRLVLRWRKLIPPRYATLLIEIDASQVTKLAAVPAVRWLDLRPAQPTLDGEREAQVLAEAIDPAAGLPVPGYRSWMTTHALQGGRDVIIAICDTGIDLNSANNDCGHPDLIGRQAGFVDYNGSVAADVDGHGTMVAGVAVGNGAAGVTEPSPTGAFLRGQGVAPAASYLTQNALAGPWPPDTWSPLVADAADHGARVMNNSWSDGGTPGAGYSDAAHQIDSLARSCTHPGEGEPPVPSPILVFSAGNEGGRGCTITPPHEAKNVIVVGASFAATPRAGFRSEAIAGLSSRGPAIDGRILPTLVAPGVDVSTAKAGRPVSHMPQPDELYAAGTGTSIAAPHVSGAAAVIIEWWRSRLGGADPSAAMVKALLVNGADDLSGGQRWCAINRTMDKPLWSQRHVGIEDGRIYQRSLTDVDPIAVVEGMVELARLDPSEAKRVGSWWLEARRLCVWPPSEQSPAAPQAAQWQVLDRTPLRAVPSFDQGWGRVSLDNVLCRLPKLLIDQTHAFTDSRQEYTLRVEPKDPARPLRITLAWTDAPGEPGARPALVNDLDLEVEEESTGRIYRGNVFADGFSTTGGDFDSINNVECVFLREPRGSYTITVIAAAIAADARPPFGMDPWQDFALVIDNAVALDGAAVRCIPAPGHQ